MYINKAIVKKKKKSHKVSKFFLETPYTFLDYAKPRELPNSIAERLLN